MTAYFGHDAARGMQVHNDTPYQYLLSIHHVNIPSNTPRQDIFSSTRSQPTSHKYIQTGSRECCGWTQLLTPSTNTLNKPTYQHLSILSTLINPLNTNRLTRMLWVWTLLIHPISPLYQPILSTHPINIYLSYQHSPTLSQKHTNRLTRMLWVWTRDVCTAAIYRPFSSRRKNTCKWRRSKRTNPTVTTNSPRNITSTPPSRNSHMPLSTHPIIPQHPLSSYPINFSHQVNLDRTRCMHGVRTMRPCLPRKSSITKNCP